MPLEIQPSGGMILKDVDMGVPPYNGNEVNYLNRHFYYLLKVFIIIGVLNKYRSDTSNHGGR